MPLLHGPDCETQPELCVKTDLKDQPDIIFVHLESLKG